MDSELNIFRVIVGWVFPLFGEHIFEYIVHIYIYVKLVVQRCVWRRDSLRDRMGKIGTPTNNARIGNGYKTGVRYAIGVFVCCILFLAAALTMRRAATVLWRLIICGCWHACAGSMFATRRRSHRVKIYANAI